MVVVLPFKHRSHENQPWKRAFSLPGVGGCKEKPDGKFLDLRFRRNHLSQFYWLTMHPFGTTRGGCTGYEESHVMLIRLSLGKCTITLASFSSQVNDESFANLLFKIEW